MTCSSAAHSPVPASNDTHDHTSRSAAGATGSPQCNRSAGALGSFRLQTPYPYDSLMCFLGERNLSKVWQLTLAGRWARHAAKFWMHWHMKEVHLAMTTRV